MCDPKMFLVLPVLLQL